MTRNNFKTFFFASLIAAMIVPFAMADYAEASCSECGDDNDLRIKADYQTVGWWTPNHHFSNYWTYVGQGETGYNTVTAQKSESGYVYPSFLVKSNSVSSKTASYDITYKFYDKTLGLKSTDARSYSNVVFNNYLDGETDRFTALSGGIDKGDYVVISIKVRSIS